SHPPTANQSLPYSASNPPTAILGVYYTHLNHTIQPLMHTIHTEPTGFEKMPAAKKFAAKTHLSPSRRRAVCRGNRETRGAMKPSLQGAPLLGLTSPWPLHSVKEVVKE
ncbi:hypothetical protein, partial [Pseudomonas aeruginosa]